MRIQSNTKNLTVGYLLLLMLLSCYLLLAGCGSGSGVGGEGPTIEVSFPPPNADLAGFSDRITIRGRVVAKDGAEVNQVLINNQTLRAANFKPPTDLPDGDMPPVMFDRTDPSQWFAKIALLRQTNEILVEASDDRGRIRTLNFAVNNELKVGLPVGVVFDGTNNRALITDINLNAVLAADLTSGDLSLISGFGEGDGPELSDPEGIALDTANNRALVTAGPFGSKAVLAVDLATGNRTVISDANTGSGTALGDPQDIVLDTANNRALVVDLGLKAVLAVDLATGNRTVISDANTGSGMALSDPVGIALDTANNRALVVDSGLNSKAVLAVDLATGDRSVISDANTGSGTTLGSPVGIVLDTANNRALVTDGFFGLKAVVAVDLATGNRTMISDANTGSGAVLGDPRGIALDTANNRALVVDSGLNSKAVLAVNLATGNRTTVISDANTGSGTALGSPVGIALDTANNRALVTDGFLGLKAVVAVDLATSNRTVVSDANTGSGTALLGDPVGIALDTANNRALVTDRFLGLMAVDLATGNRTVISDANTGSGIALRFPEGIALDTANNRALVTAGSFGLKAVLAVDLATGDRSVISDANTGSGTALGSPVGIALDTANNRALVTDGFFGLKAVVAVDLATGNRTMITGSGTALGDPRGITLDTANNRALVTDSLLDAVVEVDLATGDRTVISDANTGSGAPLSFPMGIALDTANDRALVVDFGLDALLVVDLPSSDRVIVSR